MKMANHEDENITVSKIYETLKSGPFLKNLYWDVLSDIKEKSTFKQMKETTEKLLNKKTEALSNLSDSGDDNFQRQKIVAEICTMSYAVDTVFSKVMFIKLQKEFKTHIIDSIKDLRKEKKINDSVWSKLAQDLAMSPSESSSSKSNVSVQKPAAETSSRPVRNKQHRMTPNEIAIKNYEIRSEIHKDLKAINSEEKKKETYQKKLRPKNHVTSEKQSEKMPKSILKKKQNDDKQSPPSLSLKVTEVKSKGKSCFENTEEIKITPETGFESDEDVSDVDSIISVGHESTGSVSSVHTSDLSSFDDEISLSSEDEQDGAKRRISLKDLKEMCNGKLPEKLNGSILKDLAEVSKESPGNNTEAKSKKQSEESSGNNTRAKSKKQSEESSGNNIGAKSKKQSEVSPKKNSVHESKEKIQENSKRKTTENNKQQIEESSKRKTTENNKQQIEESSKRKTVGSNKRQVEENSKRKSDVNNKSLVEKSSKNSVQSSKKQSAETDQNQIEESSQKKPTENNKLQVEVSPKKNSSAVNKHVQESPKKIVNGNKNHISKSFQAQLDSADKAIIEAKLDTSKILPKRIRKPNSKYSSENILCTITKVKERKKQTVVDNEKNTSNIAQPNKKRTRKNSSDSDDEVPPKNFKVLPFPETDLRPTLSTPKQSTPLELFKPQFPGRSLTSRRTEPVTLFST